MIKNEKESVLVQTESEKFYAKKVILTCGHWI